MYHFLNLMMCRIENLNMKIHLYLDGTPTAIPFKLRDCFVPRNDKFSIVFPFPYPQPAYLRDANDR